MFRCAQFAALSVVLLASVGCARWTLRPQADIAAQVDGSQRAAQQPAMTPAGGQRLANDQAAANASPQDDFSSNIKNLDPSLSIARLAERQGDPQQARTLYYRYIEKNPQHPLPHHRLGVMAAREAKYDEAEQHFMRAMQLAPPSVELLSDVGYCYYLLSRLDEAEQILRQGVAAEPANKMVNNNLALVMAAKGDFAQSARAFRRVNEEGQARANQAYALSQNGNLEQAREEYLAALTADNTLTTAAKALLQVDEAYKREQQALARADGPAQDPLLSAQPQPTNQPTNQPAGYAQYVAPASFEAPPAPQAQIARRTAPPQAMQLPARDVAPRGHDMAAMLMPVPPAASTLPPAQSPRHTPQRQEVTTASWWASQDAGGGVQQAGWDEQPHAMDAVQPAAATTPRPVDQPRQDSGFAISLNDETTAERKSTSFSLSDSP